MEVQERSGGPSGEPGGIGRKAEDGSGLEALPVGRGGMGTGWEAHLDARVVWKPSQQGWE